MKNIKVPTSYCPTCNYETNAYTDTSGIASPSVGDYSVCINCSGINQIGVGFALQKVEKSEIPEDIKYELEFYANRIKEIDPMSAMRKLEGEFTS